MKDYKKVIIEMIKDGVIPQKSVEKYCPELKESEDERISKALIKLLKKDGEGYENVIDGVSIENTISWLEKQGEQREQKSADEVEPKFKVGNWYQCTKNFFGKGVTFDKNTVYYCAKEGCLQDEYGCHIAIVEDLYDNFKLWTIQDAKDGDILVYGKEKRPFIFKGLLDKFHPEDPVAYCGIDCDNEFYIPIGVSWWTGEKVEPATKEQRDLLSQKMKESGYEWDAEKKELKEIEQKPAEWSDVRFTSTVQVLEYAHSLDAYNQYGKEDIRKNIKWLKSLKDRVGCEADCTTPTAKTVE